MRWVVLILAALVFLAALILDTTALLRLVATGAGLLLRAHPWWVAAAVLGVLVAVLWPYRPWRPRPRRRGKPRPPGGAARPRKRSAADGAPKPPRPAQAPPADPPASPSPRAPRKRRRAAGQATTPRPARTPFRT
jgi:hypothetical protein